MVVPALAETLMGLLTGTAIWLALLGVRWTFGLDELDRDFGLQVKRVVQELRASSRPIAPAAGAHGAIFVDVDADDDPPDEPCNVVAKLLSPGTAALNCRAGRPINRYVLARVIEKIDTSAPAAIVVDVELRREPGVVDKKEDDEIARVVAATKAPLIVAAPVDHEAVPPDGSPMTVELTPDRVSVGGRPSVIETVALPQPELPVRRYPKCYREPSGHWLGNLAFTAATVLQRGVPTDLDGLCQGQADQAARDQQAEFTPRIVYTMPSLSLRHVTTDAELPDESAITRVVYEDLFARCRTAEVFGSGQCGRPDLYAKRVVVIGASNRLRRDLHPTPLGTMAGAEVVINAIRSFELGPATEMGPHRGTLVTGLFDLVKSATLWFFYFIGKLLLERHHRKGSRRALIAKLTVGALFMVTLLATASMTVWEGYKSFSIVAAVIGMAVEQSIDLLNRLRSKVEHRLKTIIAACVAVSVVVFMPPGARAESPPCPDAFFGVSALVTRVDPSGETFK